MPIILNLLVVDFENLHDAFSSVRIFGYLVRVTVLFGLGGLVAYLHTTERQAFKLFQLGLGAPAVLLGMLNGLAQHPPDAAPKQKVVAGQTWLDWEPAAEAAEAPGEQPTKTFESAKPSAVDEFLQGFLGRRHNQMWFVISGSHPTKQAAQKQADAINGSRKGLAAEVYEPFGETKYYAVVVGAGLSKVEAKIVRERALLAGLPKDTYLWTFPKE